MEIINSLLFMLNEMSPYILLGFLIAGLMHAFIPHATMARHLSGTGWKPVLKAAAIGVPLPLCSCGVLPTAIGMRRSGASRAATTSFLIATPQTGVDSIAATWSLLGPAFAIIRPIAALVTAIFGGVAVGASERRHDPQLAHHDDHHDHSKEEADCDSCSVEPRKSFGAKLVDALRYGYIDLVGSIGSWLVIGLIIAALITVYLPADTFAALGEHPLLAMIAVLIVAIPMYVCATGSIPIAMSLMLKGLSPGTALVLLMAGPAANFASFALIRREMGNRAAWIYLAAIVAGAMSFGLIIDYLLPAAWFRLPGDPAMACCHHSLELFPSICSAILLILLIYTFIINHRNRKITTTDMTREYTIKGMNCPHCRAAVTKAIQGVEGVNEVSVDLATGIATVEGTATDEAIAAAVRAAGFDL